MKIEAVTVHVRSKIISSPWRITRTAAGNWTINGRMYPDFSGAVAEAKRLAVRAHMAKIRNIIRRDYRRESMLAGRS